MHLMAKDVGWVLLQPFHGCGICVRNTHGAPCGMVMVYLSGSPMATHVVWLWYPSEEHPWHPMWYGCEDHPSCSMWHGHDTRLMIAHGVPRGLPLRSTYRYINVVFKCLCYPCITFMLYLVKLYTISDRGRYIQCCPIPDNVNYHY